MPVDVFTVDSDDPLHVDFNLFYPDSGFGAVTVDGSGLTLAMEADTDGGVESPTASIAPDGGGTVIITFADPVTSGGTWRITALTGVTWNRPAAFFDAPATGSFL